MAELLSSLHILIPRSLKEKVGLVVKSFVQPVFPAGDLWYIHWKYRPKTEMSPSDLRYLSLNFT